MIVKSQSADVGRVKNMMQALRHTYPFLRIVPVGGSVLGREIPAMILEKGEETVVIAAAFHGQEWITSLVALRLCEDICGAIAGGRRLCDLDVRRACTGRRLVIIQIGRASCRERV